MPENLVALSLLGNCLVTAPHPARQSRSVTVYAHRGASAYAPENTLAAFQLAAEMGTPWVEIDCSLSKDGEPIVMHDLLLDRTSNGRGPISDYTVAELKTRDAGSWKDPRFAGEPIPTLGEALRFLRGKARVLLEIKSMGGNDSDLRERILTIAAGVPLTGPRLQEALNAIEQSGTLDWALTHRVLQEVSAAEMENDTVIQSFSPIPCLLARASNADIPTALLAFCERENDNNWENLLQWGRIIGVDAYNLHWDSLTDARVELLHQMKKTIACWTVDTEEQLAKCLKHGVDGIISNRPDWIQRCLDSENGRENH